LPDQHPEFEFESSRIQKVYEDLGRQITKLENSEPGGVNSAADAAVSEKLRQVLTALVHSYDEGAYHGRVDFVDCAGGSEETAYIGRHSFEADGIQVSSWASPVAALHRGTEVHQTYETPTVSEKSN
jgi:DNA helicase IV